MIIQAVEERVKQFISQLKKEWDNLAIEYAYDAQENTWNIWHFNYRLQYNDMDFQKSVGKLIRTLFLTRGFLTYPLAINTMGTIHTKPFPWLNVSLY